MSTPNVYIPDPSPAVEPVLDQQEVSTPLPARRRRTGRIILAVVLLMACIGLCAWTLFWDTGAWALAGDTARNSAGILAIIAAYFTIRVSTQTNQARTREAIRSNFRDYIQWAAAHVTSDNEFERLLAIQIINKYDEDLEIEPEDKQMVYALNQKLRELILNPQSSDLEERGQSGDNEEIHLEGGE